MVRSALGGSDDISCCFPSSSSFSPTPSTVCQDRFDGQNEAYFALKDFVACRLPCSSDRTITIDNGDKQEKKRRPISLFPMLPLFIPTWLKSRIIHSLITHCLTGKRLQCLRRKYFLILFFPTPHASISDDTNYFFLGLESSGEKKEACFDLFLLLFIYSPSFTSRKNKTSLQADSVIFSSSNSIIQQILSLFHHHNN